MSTDRVLDAVVREFADLHLEDVNEENTGPSYENHCGYARLFHHWGTELLVEYIHTDPTPMRLAQAKVLLVDRYFEWRSTIPKSHRMPLGEKGHICLHQVFEQFFLKIRLVQLSVMPVQIFTLPTPPPPPPARPSALLGITLGEVLGEE